MKILKVVIVTGLIFSTHLYTNQEKTIQIEQREASIIENDDRITEIIEEYEYVPTQPRREPVNCLPFLKQLAKSITTIATIIAAIVIGALRR